MGAATWRKVNYAAEPLTRPGTDLSLTISRSSSLEVWSVYDRVSRSLSQLVTDRLSIFGQAHPVHHDDAVYRLIFLGLKPISQKWTMPITNWKAALQQLALLSDDQLILNALMATNS
jgi:hypothetical protein